MSELEADARGIDSPDVKKSIAAIDTIAELTSERLHLKLSVPMKRRSHCSQSRNMSVVQPLEDRESGPVSRCRRRRNN